MSEAIRITCRFDVNRCSPNLRQHWRVRAKHTKAAREAGRQAWLEAGSPVASGPVRVSLLVRRARKLDQANLWSACKGLLDGVFVGALTPDDGERWVKLGSVTQESGKAWKLREECVLVVEPLL